MNTLADGVVVYQGKNQSFSDTNLDPTQTYSYGLFAVDLAGNVALPIHFDRLAPIASGTTLPLSSTGTGTPTPVLILLRISLSPGMTGDEVKILQGFLLQDPSI